MVSNVRFVKWLVTLSKIINRITNTAETDQIYHVGVQARDPSVHAAILAHLNQKYGSGSGADPSSPEKNKVVRRPNTETHSFHLYICLIFVVIISTQTNAKDKDVPKPTTDLSEDLFKVHDFDVKIDLQVPSAGDDSPSWVIMF